MKDVTTAILICLLLASSSFLAAQDLAAQDEAGAVKDYQSAPPAVNLLSEPLTEGERLLLCLKHTFSPLAFVTSAASAGIGQARNRPREWGQGGEGYGRRYASSFAGRIVRQSIMFGVSSALHEDDRYMPSAQATTRARLEHALASTFVARDQNGQSRFAVSRIAGFAGAAFLSRLWQPRSNRSFRSGAAALGTSLPIAVGFSVGREFLPAIFGRR